MSDEFHDWDDTLLSSKLRLSPSNTQLNFSTFVKLRRSYFLGKIIFQSTNLNAEPMNHSAGWEVVVCIWFCFLKIFFAFVTWLVWFLLFIYLGNKGKVLNLAFIRPNGYIKWSKEINICERLKMPKRKKCYSLTLFSI